MNKYHTTKQSIIKLVWEDKGFSWQVTYAAVQMHFESYEFIFPFVVYKKTWKIRTVMLLYFSSLQ